MIQQQTELDIADNTGAKRAMCIKVLRGSSSKGKFKRKVANVGDIIICAVKKTLAGGDVKQGEIIRCVVVRTKQPILRKDGSYVRFDKNAAVATSDIERVLGEPLKHQLPSDYRVAVEAVNTGIPLVLGDSKLSKAVRTMASDLGGIAKEPEQQSAPGGVLGRLAWRRI